MRKLILKLLAFIVLMITVLLFQMTSCIKANCEIAIDSTGCKTITDTIYIKVKDTVKSTSTINGLWIGSYKTNEPNVNDVYYSYVIQPDGDIIVETKYHDQKYIAVGTWKLEGNSFTCSYKYIYSTVVGDDSNIGTIQNATATWDSAGRLSGSWKNVDPDNGIKGTFTLDKIN